MRDPGVCYTPDLLDPPDPDVPCCMGSAMGGSCTCWMPVYDQSATRDTQEGPSEARKRRCSDCAFRPDSPERQAMDGDPMDARRDVPFLCHDGMPRAIAYAHPDGTIRDQDDTGDYQPVQKDGRAWQADGTPAVVCAGWRQTIYPGSRGTR